MEDIFEKIINIEKEARESVSDAEKQKNSIKANMDKEISALKNRFETQAERRCRIIREQSDKFAELGVAEVNRKCENDIRSLADKYEQNKERWTAEIVSAVTDLK